MTTTMIPPPHERDTEPPDNPRESSMPPADLGPTGIALRLLALEEKVSEIHSDTAGTGRSLGEIKIALKAIGELATRIAANVSILREDAIGQRKVQAQLISDIDELKRRAMAEEEELQ